jgi:hypothetical protein
VEGVILAPGDQPNSPGCPDDDYANVESQPASAPAHLLHAGHPDENYRPNAITLGASAPTLILEAVYFRSIYQTEHPRDWDIKGSNQEPSRGHTQNQAPNPSSPSTEEIGSQIAQGHAADGTKQSEQNNSNSEPSWVPLAQGLSAIAGLITTVGCTPTTTQRYACPAGVHWVPDDYANLPRPSQDAVQRR